MKKIIFIVLAILVFAMIFTNKNESEFLQKIKNSKDPYSKFYMERLYEKASPIIKSKDYYFSPVFDLNYTNLGIISIAKLESGWMGTLRIDGSYLEKYVDKVSVKKYLIVFGNEIGF